MRTLHVGLRVADLERSIAFYTTLGYEMLGEVPESELGRLAMLKLPDDEFVSLELVHDPKNPGVSPGRVSHLVIHVADVRETVARVVAQGIEAEAPTSPDGSDDFWTAWVTDPDGLRLELVQWPEGHPEGLTRSDLTGSSQAMTKRSAKDVVGEMFQRQRAGDGSVLEDLVAVDLVNHAAGPQGREGLRRILRVIENDLGPTEIEQHHLIGEGDLVTQHLTLRGIHRASTMPLLADTTVSGRPAAWTFIHIWRVVDGIIVEHWACRDDMGLLAQLND